MYSSSTRLSPLSRSFPAYLLNLFLFVLSGLSAHGVECVGGVACERGTTDRCEGSYSSNQSKETLSTKGRVTHVFCQSIRLLVSLDVADVI